MDERETRRGSLWTGEDYQEFFAALATTATDQEIANQLGRSPGAVRARARFVLRDSYTSAVAIRKLREMVTAPGFDGQALAREAHAAKGYPFWDQATDEQLILAWAQSPPASMASLVERFGVQEQDIARRCIRLGLTTSTTEVAVHLGAEPGKTLDTWARIARDSATVAVGVLVVTSSTGAVVHLSLHPDIDAAARACRELDESGLINAPAAWTIATRIVGEGDPLVQAWESSPPASGSPLRDWIEPAYSAAKSLETTITDLTQFKEYIAPVKTAPAELLAASPGRTTPADVLNDLGLDLKLAVLSARVGHQGIMGLIDQRLGESTLAASRGTALGPKYLDLQTMRPTDTASYRTLSYSDLSAMAEPGVATMEEWVRGTDESEQSAILKYFAAQWVTYLVTQVGRAVPGTARGHSRVR